MARGTPTGRFRAGQDVSLRRDTAGDRRGLLTCFLPSGPSSTEPCGTGKTAPQKGGIVKPRSRLDTAHRQGLALPDTVPSQTSLSSQTPTLVLPRLLFDAFNFFIYLDRKDKLFKSKMQ